MWVCDLLYLEADGQYTAVLSMRDVCLRWAIAVPLRTAKSEEVAKAMISAWHQAGVHFQPEIVVHDNGSEFKRVFEAACSLINVQQKWSIAGRAESHGLTAGPGAAQIFRFSRAHGNQPDANLLIKTSCVWI